MSNITNIAGGDLITSSRQNINNNFTALNNDKVETSVISTDNTLGGTNPSDLKLSTEKAVNEFVKAVASPVGKSWNEYAESTNGTDSYAITVPGVTALVIGQTFKFKADVANSGACTLNVNGLGAKSIKKSVSIDLGDNDILASQDVTVIYDGTNMQMVSFVTSQIPTSLPITSSAGTTTYTWNRNSHPTLIITHNLGTTPNYIRVKITPSSGNSNPNAGMAELVYIGGQNYGFSSLCTTRQGSLQITSSNTMIVRSGNSDQNAQITGTITSSTSNSFVLTFVGSGDETNLWSSDQTAIVNWEIIK